MLLLPIELRAGGALSAAALLLTTGGPAMAIDLDAMWDFGKPALSEERFRAALATAQGDDVLILKTQIARSWGLRRDFERARSILAEAEPAVKSAGAEAQARYWLELGRTYASAAHEPKQLTDEAKSRASGAYANALAAARQGKLDALAVDAVHMGAFVEAAPAHQLRVADEALAIIEKSDQTAARNWEATMRNNRGYALHQLKRYDDALAEFRRALALRERQGKPGNVRVAHWMIAWTLRHMGRLDEAREIQLRLEREWDEAKEPDPYVFEELEAIYKAQGNTERAAHYAARLKASKAGS
jgi:tetratricopeptide (TPR) repeat protein